MNIPEHMFIFEGDLYDTRGSAWACLPPLRKGYRTHWSRDGAWGTAQVKAALRAGELAWPGRLPMFMITDDGGCLHFDCVRDELRNVLWSIKSECSDGWRVVACDINYEDGEMICAHCGERIESAYGEEEEDQG